MDDFFVVGDSFDDCLIHLANALRRCKECNSVLKWEKCNFMVKEGILLGHRISNRGIKVEKKKIEVIENLPPVVEGYLEVFWAMLSFIGDSSRISQKLQILFASFLRKR